MPIAMRCPGCDTRFEFESELEGKRIKCKNCGDVFRVEKPVRKRRDEDENDRPSPAKKRKNADEERPAPRSRRAVVDEDDDRPRRRDDYDDEPAPKRKKPLLLIGAGFGGFALVGVVVLLIVLLKGKKGNNTVDLADIVKAPTKSTALEVPEKDIDLLVVPDSGTTFGILRKKDTGKTWYFDPYDVTAGRRLGRLEMPDMDAPRYASLSADGKLLLIDEGGGFANSEHFLSIWSIPESKALARKWNPYPRPAKGGFDPPVLYRAEFCGNDKVVTVSTARTMDVWALPSFESLVAGEWIEGSKDKLNKDERGSQDKKVHGYQRNLAFTADRARFGVWNGDGYSFIQSADAVGLTQTPSVSALAKSLWPNDTHFNSTKPEACSFSPDGKTFAAIIMNDWAGTKKYALCLWDVQNPGDPTKYVMPANQYHESLSIMWWGNKYIATQGGQREGMIVEVRTGLAKRQIMVPNHSHASFGRDGRLWYAISAENKDPATIIMVDGLDPDQLSETDDYEQIRELGEEFHLRRLWLEPSGVLRKPSRYNPPITKRLIRRP